MRTVRHRKPENFLSALARNGHGIVEEEPLIAAEAADEALVMGLRLAEGIDAGASPSASDSTRSSTGQRSTGWSAAAI